MKRSPLKPGSKPLSRSKQIERSVSAFTAHRSELARVSGLARGKPLAQISEKRKRENVTTWPALKRIVRQRDGNRCQAADIWPEIVCSTEPLMTVHHKDPTGMGYPRICSPDRVVCLCAAHHVGPGGVHNGGQSKARALGLLR